MLEIVRQIIVDPTLPMERVREAWALYREEQAGAAKRAYETAMSAAQAEFPPINKNRHVQFASKKEGSAGTDYRHEDLAELVEKCGPILAKHGISRKWRTTNKINEPITVTCILTHVGGHSEDNTLSGPRDDSGNKNSLQAIASTVTLLERYTFKSLIGMASRHDDDGKAGGDPPAPAVISDIQRQDLQLKIVEADADIVKFCIAFKIETIADLPVNRLQEALDLLSAKKAKKVKKEMGEGQP